MSTHHHPTGSHGDSVAAAEKEGRTHAARLRHEALAEMMGTEDLSSAKEDENSWQFTYMDMITLMFSVFVLLLAISGKQASKQQELVEGMKAKQYSEIMAQKAPPSPTLSSPEQAAWDAISSRIAAQGLGDQVSLKTVKGGLVMTMKETLLFPSGSAELSEQGSRWIQEIASLIHSDVELISVEGHTDNIPIATDKFPSNWELSSGRASKVVREMIVAGLPSDKLRAIGYADTRPVAYNAFPDGRAQNRRVQIQLDYTKAEEVKE